MFITSTQYIQNVYKIGNITKSTPEYNQGGYI